MTDQEQIDHLRDQIFKLRLAVKGVSGIAASGAKWAESSGTQEDFKRIERQLAQACEEITMTP